MQARTERTTRRLDARSFGTDLELRKSDTVAVVVGEETIVEWTIRVIPDALPVAAFLSTPSEGKGNVLRIRYRASDDYGLTGVRAVVTRDRKTSDAERKAINLTLPRMGAKKAVSSSFHDLTAHPGPDCRCASIWRRRMRRGKSDVAPMSESSCRNANSCIP